jgi:fucose permease
MSGVTLFTGRSFPERCAPLLTFLNFSWSIGALAAPLIAARILIHHSYQTAYILFAVASGIAAIACGIFLRDAEEPVLSSRETGSPTTALLLVAMFAFAAFLQVGIENTVAAWLPSYALRMDGSGVVLAAASTSFYWAGFLSSRGLSSLLLMRAAPMRVFQFAVFIAFAAALLLELAPTVAVRNAAMFVLGAALAPTYPLVLAGFFARTSHTGHSRWILFTAGFGGSVIPWIAGFISSLTGSLRAGMLTIPAALLLMAFVLPGLRGTQSAKGRT